MAGKKLKVGGRGELTTYARDEEPRSCEKYKGNVGGRGKEGGRGKHEEGKRGGGGRGGGKRERKASPSHREYFSHSSFSTPPPLHLSLNPR